MFSEKDINFQGNQLMVFSKEPQHILTDLIQAVTNLGVKINSVDIEEPNLESVFLHLTGRSLRD